MLYTIVNFTTQCGENRHTDIANFATLIDTIKLIQCVAIFTILYGNYYPPHGELELICIGKFARQTWVNFTQQYGKNRQRFQRDKFYYAVRKLLLYYYRDFPEKFSPCTFMAITLYISSPLFFFFSFFLSFLFPFLSLPSRHRSLPWECDRNYSLGCCIEFAGGHMETAENLWRYHLTVSAFNLQFLKNDLPFSVSDEQAAHRRSPIQVQTQREASRKKILISCCARNSSAAHHTVLTR